MAKHPAARQSESLLDHWHASVRACRHLVDDLAEAEDCASAALEALVSAREQVNDPRGFAVSTARRRATDVVRRKRWDRERALRYVGHAHEVDGEPDERCLAEAEAAWVIAKIWPQLPVQAKVVAELRAADHSLADIALRTGLTVRSIDGHLRRTREAARRALAATLAALGAVWGVGRRSAPAAPAALAVVAIGALTLSPHLPVESAPSQKADAPATQAYVRPAADADATSTRQPATTDTSAQSSTRKPARGGTKAYERDVVIQTPAGSVAPITVGDTGGDEQGTVEVLTACLDDFQISMQQIGCSG